MISRAKPIARTNMTAPAVEDILLGTIHNCNVQLTFNIAAHPHIVVPDKKMNRDPAICDLRQFSEDPYVSLRHHLAILEPEIEHIAKDQDHGGIRTYAFKEADDPALPVETTLPVRVPEVKVGKDRDPFTGGNIP